MLANELEARFFGRAIDRLRRLGVDVPIIPTSYWGGEDLSALPPLTVGDMLDVHSYGEVGALAADPRRTANFIAWIGAAQVEGKPLAISEWNVEYPKRDRFTAPLYVAAIASLQGWAAPMLYDYLQTKVEPPTKLDIWSTASDPALTALMPAAAIMFRRQDVRRATRTYRFAPAAQALYSGAISPETSATLRTLVERSRLVIALPHVPALTWEREGASTEDRGAITVTAPDRDFLDSPATPAERVHQVVSDTGELSRDWATGIETVETPLSQAACGRIGGKTIALGDVELHIETPDATVAFTSLDGLPIVSSGRILLTVVGPVVASPGEALPLLAQSVRGSFSVQSVHPGLTITPLSPGANPTASPTSDHREDRDRIPGRPMTGGRQGFTLPETATHWFLIEQAASNPTARPHPKQH